LIDITPYLRKFDAYRLFPIGKLPLPIKLKGAMIKKAYRSYARLTGENPFSTGIQGLKGKKFGPFLQKANAYYSIKHRLRMVLLYLWGERENRLVVRGANKTEYMIGFFVKHGCDDAADVMPLLNLYKTQVLQLARYLKVPSSILNRPPSPDLVPGIIDEEVIGIPYEKLDMILLALERGWESLRIGQVLETGESQIELVRDLVRRSEHMRVVYHPN
jgi:NAD+ synthase